MIKVINHLQKSSTLKLQGIAAKLQVIALKAASDCAKVASDCASLWCHFSGSRTARLSGLLQFNKLKVF